MTGIRTANADGKVIDMNRNRGTAGLSPIRQAEAYWTALREGNNIPRRSQIDPRGLENILPHAFIVERIAPGIARFRLAGQHLCQLAGMEVRGMPLTSFFTPVARNQIAAILEHMFDAPATVELSLAGETGKHRPPANAHMILLPLASDLGQINRALGVLVAEALPAPGTLMRFDLTGTTMRQVDDRFAAADRPMAGPEKSREIPGFAESQEPMRRRAPHLRLVK